MLAALLKKLRSFRSANQMTRKRTRLDATARVKLAEMCNCLLDNTPAHPHAAHQPPITVDLPVLLHRRVAQIHAPKSDSQTPAKTLGWHYTPKSYLADSQPLDSIRPPRQINPPIPAQLRKLG